MSLINNFPEIKIFFEKENFDSDELDDFIFLIEKKYFDKTLRKSALTLIKLEILKFKIEENGSSKESDTNIDKEFIESNLTIDNKKNNIKSISEKIQVSAHLIIELFKQKSILKKESDYINEKEYLLLNDFFTSKIEAIERASKQEQRILKSRRKKVVKSIYKGIPVYNNISQNKGVGKLIYIRKK
ncbi:hypothetical protein EV196_11334 [Mariniflexile fucanivorans]|uniref:Uncharacterized protein n=1 Tax=Mariniflexile fucanivorans TaxID=264023 RepID=A0A4R1R9T6_9FLAO|nr:hypothetical protein [Mariniflexile fucanivorans]TCL62493.1 hypothetical protein EV196_11334 [Mariniflexile fucanivorans]